MIYPREAAIDWGISKYVDTDDLANKAELVFNCDIDGHSNDAYIFTTSYDNLFLYTTAKLQPSITNPLSLLIVDQSSGEMFFRHYGDHWRRMENQEMWLNNVEMLIKDKAFRDVVLDPLSGEVP